MNNESSNVHENQFSVFENLCNEFKQHLYLRLMSVVQKLSKILLIGICFCLVTRFIAFLLLYKIAAAIDRRCEIYKRPYLRNRSTNFQKCVV